MKNKANFKILLLSMLLSNAQQCEGQKKRIKIVWRPPIGAQKSVKTGEYIRQQLFEQISSERISKNLKSVLSERQSKSLNSFGFDFRELTQKPYIGDKGVDENTLYVYNKWTNQGIKTSFANYSVLISTFNKDKPNSVSILKLHQIDHVHSICSQIQR